MLYLGTVGRAQGLGFAVRAAHIAQRNGTPVVLRIVIVVIGLILASVHDPLPLPTRALDLNAFAGGRG